MRKTLCALALLLCGYTFAQDQWQKVFRTDPYLSNGYFIVNHDAWQQMGIAKIDIDINMSTLLANGTVEKSNLQRFTWVLKGEVGELAPAILLSECWRRA